MTTTPIAERLLARAMEYEQKAAALRIAAAEMNGHALDRKQQGIAATMTQAIKLREQQNGNGGPPRSEVIARRNERLVALLTEQGPSKATDLHAVLEQEGIAVSHARLIQVLRELGARVVGASTNARWRLKPKRSSAPPEPIAAALKSVQSDYAATKERRAAKADQIVAIIRKHGKPMKTKELVAAAREQGIDSLTGIYGLVHRGLLASKGQGLKRTYRYVEQ